MSFGGLFSSVIGLLLAFLIVLAILGGVIFCIIFFSVRAKKRRAQNTAEGGTEQ